MHYTGGERAIRSNQSMAVMFPCCPCFIDSVLTNLFIDVRRLVWSDFSRAAIEQYHFNSSQRALLLNNALVLPGPVAIRPSDRRIYGADSSRIFYYTGSSSPNTLLTGDLNLVQGLAFIGDDLYWSESHAIKMAPDTEVARGLNGVTGLVAVDTSAPGKTTPTHS